MLTDAHEGKVNIPIIINTSGDNIIVTHDSESWIYIHELIGDAAAPVTLTVKTGSVVVASFTLDAGQGITEQDVPGDDGVPRFKCNPSQDFILNLSSGVAFNGALQYSRKY